jgi:hypothetical protein
MTEYAAGLAVAREHDDRTGMVWCLVGLGQVAQVRGDAEVAAAWLQEGLALAWAMEAKPEVSEALAALGMVAWRQGDAAAALAQLRESLTQRWAMGARLGIAEGLEQVALVAGGQQQLARAARLLGAAEALRQTIGAPRPPVDRPIYEATLETTRLGLGTDAFAAAWAAGQALTLEQAVAEALADDVEGVGAG